MHESLEVDEEKVIVADIDPKPEQMQDHIKDQGEELIDIKLVGERKSAQPIFISVPAY